MIVLSITPINILIIIHTYVVVVGVVVVVVVDGMPSLLHYYLP